MNNLSDILYKNTVCNICGKPFNKPFRSYDSNGNIVHGCVDGSHTGYLVPLSASAIWHNRKEAKEIRAAFNRFISV